MENRKLNVLRQVVENGFGKTDLNVIDQYIHDDWIEHQLSLQGGKEVLKKAILSIGAGFSNKLYELQDYAINEDIVWVHYRFSAVHAGSFMGIEPTGKKVTIDVMDIARIKHEQIVEHWGIPDRFSLLMQLGFFQRAASAG